MNQDPFKLIIPIEVRFSDLDALGHVNNVTYFTYFEIARVKHLQTVSGKPVAVDDIKLVIVEAICRYRSPALLGDVLQVGVRVSHMRRSSFAYEYGIWSGIDGRLVAEGQTVQTVFDHHTQRAALIQRSREQATRTGSAAPLDRNLLQALLSGRIRPEELGLTPFSASPAAGGIPYSSALI